MIGAGRRGRARRAGPAGPPVWQQLGSPADMVVGVGPPLHGQFPQVGTAPPEQHDAAKTPDTASSIRNVAASSGKIIFFMFSLTFEILEPLSSPGAYGEQSGSIRSRDVLPEVTGLSLGGL